MKNGTVARGNDGAINDRRKVLKRGNETMKSVKVTVNRDVSEWRLAENCGRASKPISSMIEVKIDLMKFRAVIAEGNFFWYTKDVAPAFSLSSNNHANDAICQNMEDLWDNNPNSVDFGHSLVNIVGLHQLIQHRIDAEMSDFEAVLKGETMCDTDSLDVWPNPPKEARALKDAAESLENSIKDITEIYRIR